MYFCARAFFSLNVFLYKSELLCVRLIACACVPACVFFVPQVCVCVSISLSGCLSFSVRVSVSVCLRVCSCVSLLVCLCQTHKHTHLGQTLCSGRGRDNR